MLSLGEKEREKKKRDRGWNPSTQESLRYALKMPLENPPPPLPQLLLTPVLWEELMEKRSE